VLTAALSTQTNSNGFFDIFNPVDTCTGQSLNPSATCSYTLANRTNSCLSGSDVATVTVSATPGGTVTATASVTVTP
jgi:hypothetical protein